jgi:hypothetical protein
VLAIVVAVGDLQQLLRQLAKRERWRAVVVPGAARCGGEFQLAEVGLKPLW